MNRLRVFLEDLSLRSTIAAALIVGLAVPVGISAWINLAEQQTALLNRLNEDHARIVDVLALGMQTPLWEIRPDAGRSLLEALMLDKRVTAIVVTSPLMPKFLEIQAPQRRHGEVISRESMVVHEGEEIGRVRVDMDTGQLKSQLAMQWGQVLLTGLLQFITGLLIIFALLRYKVMAPVQRLVTQSEALAAGTLDQLLLWRRGDELGVLGRSFERMRHSLRKSFADLEQRNRDLQDREAELANQAAVLRALLDNMTDGVTLVDENRRLLVWNNQFIEIMEVSGNIVYPGMLLEELVKFDLSKGRFSTNEEATLQAMRQSFQPDKPCAIQYQLADGRYVTVRRRPMPDGGFVSTYTDVTEQVEAQRKVEESRRLLEAVMDAVPAILHVKNCNLRYQVVNRRFLEWLDLERDAVLGNTSDDVYEQEISVPAKERDRQVLQSRKPLPFQEILYARGQSEPVTMWSTKVPLLNANGEVTHIVTVGLDISERKKTEQERQRWAQLLHDAIESIPNGFAVYDIARRLVICNTAFASLYGVTADALRGISFAELRSRFLQQVLTIDGQPPEDLLQEAQVDEQPWSFSRKVSEIHLKDGRWFLVNQHPTAERGIVLVRTDITALKRMEQAMRESEQRFRSIAEAHPVPLVISALKENRLLYVSPGMASLFGASVEEISNIPPQQFFVEQAELKKIKRKLSEKGTVDSFECLMKKVDGVHFPVAITAKRIDYLGLDAAVSSVVDLSAIKRAEQEIARQREALHQGEKLSALGSLLAGVAHELNNPLSVVVGRALMLEETATEPRTKASVQKLRLAAERCARIVKTFLAIARQQPPQRAPVQLNTLVETAVELVGYGLRTADIEVCLELEPELPELLADADQLTQVFTNLIVNAQQALLEVPLPRRLCIVTGWEREAGEVRIEFMDNGPGVAEEIRTRIFEPFYTSKPVGVGTGFGLSFSYGVIESHGGRLSLEPSAGGGAHFIIRLPLGGVVAAVATGGEAPGGEAPPRAVLIVDDEPDIAEMLGELLAPQGHRIDIAASGHEALGYLGATDYDVILSDLKMPDLDGPGLYRQLQQRYPHLLKRIVFITGDTLGMGASTFLAQTGCPLIEKPFVPSEVIQVVHRILNLAD